MAAGDNECDAPGLLCLPEDPLGGGRWSVFHYFVSPSARSLMIEQEIALTCGETCSDRTDPQCMWKRAK